MMMMNLPKAIAWGVLSGAILLAGTSAAMAQAQAARRVRVTLSDEKIDMPETIPDGWIVFAVSNTGRSDHGMVMEGQGFTRRIVGRLAPRGRTTVRVRLFAGTYEVYCPIGDNARRGLRTQVHVIR